MPISRRGNAGSYLGGILFQLLYCSFAFCGFPTYQRGDRLRLPETLMTGCTLRAPYIRRRWRSHFSINFFRDWFRACLFLREGNRASKTINHAIPYERGVIITRQARRCHFSEISRYGWPVESNHNSIVRLRSIPAMKREAANEHPRELLRPHEWKIAFPQVIPTSGLHIALRR